MFPVIFLEFYEGTFSVLFLETYGSLEKNYKIYIGLYVNYGIYLNNSQNNTKSKKLNEKLLAYRILYICY